MNGYSLKYFILLLIFLDTIFSNGIKEIKARKKIKSLKGIHFCGVDKMKIEISKNYISEMIKNPVKRKLDNDDYKPIRIFLDTTYINYQGESNKNLKNMISKCITAMNKCISTFEKLLKVIPLNNKIKYNLEQAMKNKIEVIHSNLIMGISTDLLIFPRIANEHELDESVLANASPLQIENKYNRPIIGIVNINPNIDFSLGNSIDFLQSILLHEFTHILGFSYSLFDYFPGGLNNTIFVKKDTRLGLNRTYVKTKKLIETAKKYFNCDRIDGIELENQGGGGTAGSHWEARILLGDYMNGNLYPIEQVISEFTLALLEDSGWYKINYYTGGLMRYGKHQGCAFIEEDCLNKNNLETKFNNDFFNIGDFFNSRCSSGRQSRGYNLLYILSEDDIENEEYLRFGNKTGYMTADYCPICQEYSEESNNLYYIGNCQKGNYNYGTKIIFGRIFGYENEEIPKILGEKFSQNSFCSLTSVIPKNEKYSKYKATHSACYPMFCSEKSLTIQINEQFIVCPRQGGKVSISKNYEGFIYCPDYNLICTGTVICNDMIDCVEKESLIKNNTYDYDYEINNSQDIDQIEISDVLIGYELSDDGICPKNCIQCLNNKKCFQCLDGYNLIGINENDLEPIICSNNINITNGYYKVENIYYKCFKDCEQCTSKNNCNKCVKNKKLNYLKNECINKIDNCEEYDKNENCIRCIKNYTFLEDNRTKCININDKTIIDINKYYTEDDGISYYPCDKYIKNCDECSSKNECNKCISEYIILDNNRTICLNKSEFDENKKAYKIDEYNYKSCNKAINNCITCNSENHCLSCDNNYGILNEKFNECGFLEGKENNYYLEQSNGIYYFCNKTLKNCLECINKNTCTICDNGYDFDPYHKCVNSLFLSESFLDNNNEEQNCSNFISNCKFCSSKDICNYCNYNYSFLNNNRNECKFEDEFKGNNNYYTLDSGINYYTCEFEPNINGIGNCSECQIINYKLECLKCKEQYEFLDNNLDFCYDIKNELDEKIKDKTIYKGEDEINYYTCKIQIENCNRCENNSICLECLENYAFLSDNFTKCYPKNNFEIGYYSNEDETIFYPCVDNCAKCSNNSICIKCKSDYAFIGNDRTKCINITDKVMFNINKYYTEDEGISYFPCNISIENCDECLTKNECIKRIYEYIFLDNNKTICLNKNDLDKNKKAYKIDENNYKSCNKVINNCITCNSETHCLSCINGYGIINDIYSKCESLEGKENKYYYEKEKGIFYSCNRSLKYCEECSDNNTCTLCSNDDFVVPFNESKCINKNKNYYYFYDIYS